MVSYCRTKASMEFKLLPSRRRSNSLSFPSLPGSKRAFSLRMEFKSEASLLLRN